MKIAIVTDWFAPRRGGIESQLLELAERLGRRGHEVRVITPTRGAVSGARFLATQLPVLTWPGSDLAVSPRLCSAMRAELSRGYDVVHAHVSVVSPAAYAAATAARALDLPTVVTFHSVLRHKRFLLRAADAIAGLAASRVEWTAVSRVVAAQVESALRGTVVSELPNGIDAAFWTTHPPKHADRIGTTIVSAMRLHPKKRPLPLIRAFVAAVGQANVPARLIIVGDGPERPRVEREVERLAAGALATVQLRPWASPVELRSLYAEADAFAIASTREAFGIATLEARAAGLPVVAMSAAGSSEFLVHGANALLCRDDADLARNLARVIGDELTRERLAGNGMAPDRYDWSHVIPAHERVYGQAIARAAGAVLAAQSA